MKALIKVGYSCNENCTFCHTLDVRHIDGSAAEVNAKIDRAAALGHTTVVLSGGEPTMRPELVDWASRVAALGLDFGLVTNGRMLCYPELVDKLLERRLAYVYLSLHGGTARVHNAIIRADGFDQSVAAIRLLAGRGLDFTVNTVVTRQNLTHLRDVVDLLLGFPDVAIKFSMVQPKGGGARAFDALTPSVTEVADRVADAIAYGRERAPGRRFAHDGIPLCLLPGLEDLYDDLKTHRFATMIEIGEPDFFPVDDLAKIQPPRCEPCTLRGPCPGLYRGYHETRGDAELRPVTGRPRSNSFHWVFETLVPEAPGGGCPVLHAGVTPWDRGRHLFVRHDGKTGRFRATTRDFADVEIAAIKHELGQVYLDASRKPAPDDFERDLVQLRRSATCAPCPEHDRCTGLYEPVFENVFARDDAAVRAHFERLRGDVLDVGCGHGPYGELLAPLAERGLIRYVGIDPDAERIVALRRRWPWADLRVSDAEGFAPGDGERFDHILLLRSWNHLADPAGALAALRAALRPGGSVLVVDNTAFGLARTPAQARRAEASSARLEHYRNDRADDAARAVAAAGFDILDRREVGPATSNQWLVLATAPGERLGEARKTS